MIEASYLATRPERAPDELAESIALEQSLEIVRELIPEDIREQFLGQVLETRRVGDDLWSIRIAYPTHLASGQLGQLMQLLYGNVSLYPRIRLIDLSIPAGLAAQFSGPIEGIPGIRQRIDVFDRALLLTVLKPRGSHNEHLAQLAERFARAGGDILKDDQNLVEPSHEEFVARVSACADAVERARDASGRECLYLPHVAGSGSGLYRRLEWIAERGLAGAVMCPWIMGLETVSTAARDHDLMWLAHPAGAGSHSEPLDHGIAHELVFGQLPRMAGADLTIFPGAGGRISVSSSTAIGGPTDDHIVQALTAPFHSIRPSLPCSGGGKTLADLPATAGALGPDSAIVIGGDLLRQGDQLEAATQRAIGVLREVALSNSTAD